MNIYKVKQYTAALLLIIGLIACTKEEEGIGNPTGKGELVTVTATIGETNTKASLEGADDPLSYRKFVIGDKIGFYALGGLVADNQELTLNDKNQFTADFHWNEGAGYATNLFSYYPYADEAKSSGAGTSIFKTTKTPAGATYQQIEDFLVAQPTTGAVDGVPISLAFKHAFSMLIIMRGNGFELSDNNKADDKRVVTVTMSEAVNGVKVAADSRNLELLSGAVAEKTFTATEGKYDGKEAWFVIVPAGLLNSNTIIVESITLYKSNGLQETIKPQKTITPESNYKYPLTAEVKNADATIYPHEIRRWTEENINLDRPAGIYEEADLYAWYTLYNTPDALANEANNEDFAKYGRKIGTRWTFYIRSDLKMSELENVTGYSSISKVVETLSDTLDCCGFTFDGLALDNSVSSNPTGFIGTIGTSGVLMNLVVKDAVVKGVGNEVGTLAGKNDGGKIINCKVTGTSIVNGADYVGGLVGNHASGLSEDCKSSAFVTGTGTNVDKLVGVKGGTISNCTSSGTVIK